MSKNLIVLVSFLSLVLPFSVTVMANNFQTYDSNAGKGIECIMNQKGRLELDRAIGLKYGEKPPTCVFLKDAVAGTEVLLDDTKVSTATPSLSVNGYQAICIPQDEYNMTLKRPNGNKLQFSFLRSRGFACVLNWEEISKTLNK